MGFTDKQKLEIKQKGHYLCSICYSLDFVDVHHIIPISEGGEDVLENAAPLCKRCHDTYGANPEKRKWIREKRDFLFKNGQEIFRDSIIGKQLETAHFALETYHQNQNRLEQVENVVGVLQNTVIDLVKTNQLLISKMSNASDAEKPKYLPQIGLVSGTIVGTASSMMQIGGGASFGTVIL